MPRMSTTNSPFFYASGPARWVGRILITTGLGLVIFSALVFASTAHAETPASSPALPLAQVAADGKAIFDAKCAGCHSIGGGKRVGPDLKDVTTLRDAGWLKNFISDPPKMLASDPAAQQLLKEYNNLSMPNLGLSPAQVDALVAFLGNPGPLPYTPSQPSIPGDSKVGQRLFSGETALTKGGPACIACHTVSGVASMGGGALGPDLTHVVQRLGEPGLAGALNAIAFPTMLDPFKNRPLAPKEQADLVAYLKSIDRSQGPVQAVMPGAVTSTTLVIFGVGLAGAGVLFGLLLFIWARLKKRYDPRLPVREV